MLSLLFVQIINININTLLLLPNETKKIQYIINPKEELEVTIIEENTMPFEIIIKEENSIIDTTRILFSGTTNYAKYKVKKKEIIIKNINKKPIKLEIKEIRRKIK